MRHIHHHWEGSEHHPKGDRQPGERESGDYRVSLRCVSFHTSETIISVHRPPLKDKFLICILIASKYCDDFMKLATEIDSEIDLKCDEIVQHRSLMLSTIWGPSILKVPPWWIKLLQTFVNPPNLDRFNIIKEKSGSRVEIVLEPPAKMPEILINTLVVYYLVKNQEYNPSDSSTIGSVRIIQESLTSAFKLRQVSHFIYLG